jgi:hypothetical protein
MKGVLMIEQPNVRIAELDPVDLVVIRQDGLGVGSMELHSSCLLPLHRVVLEMAAASAVEESF